MNLVNPPPLTASEIIGCFVFLVFICAIGATYFTRRF